MKRPLRTHATRASKTLVRDAHDPDRVYVSTTIHDDDIVDLNAKIRSAKLMKIGQRLPSIDEHADVAVQFQWPSYLAVQLAQEAHPDIFAELSQGGDASIRAGERLALLYPQYVTSIKGRDTVAVPREAMTYAR